MLQSVLSIDSLTLIIGFEDGDGDIGNELGINMNVIDNRTGNVYDSFRLPPISEQGANNGVDGTIAVKLLNTCCFEPITMEPCIQDAGFPVDELTLDITITDRAGNVSNVITTPAISLQCI